MCYLKCDKKTLNRDYAKDRFLYLDLIKIFSCFLVVIYHMNHINQGFFSIEGYHMSIEKVLISIGACSVPLFFMVNGCLMLQKNYSTEKIYAKAAKIALLTLVWNFIKFPDWFFKTLLVLYLIYPIIVKVINSKYEIYLLIAIFIFPFLYNFFIMLIIRFFPNFSLNLFGLEISLNNIPLRTGFFTMYSILYFILGKKLHVNRLPVPIAILSIVLGILLICFDCITFSNYNNEILDTVNGCFPTIGALLLSVGIFRVFQLFDNIGNKTIIKACEFLGQNVLSVYIFHMFQIKFLFSTVFQKEIYPFFVLVAISLLVCFNSNLIAIILKRIPYVKHLLKI